MAHGSLPQSTYNRVLMGTLGFGQTCFWNGAMYHNANAPLPEAWSVCNKYFIADPEAVLGEPSKLDVAHIEMWWQAVAALSRAPIDLWLSHIARQDFSELTGRSPTRPGVQW